MRVRCRARALAPLRTRATLGPRPQRERETFRVQISTPVVLNNARCAVERRRGPRVGVRAFRAEFNVRHFTRGEPTHGG